MEPVLRILLVEDDAEDVLLLRRALSEAVGNHFAYQLLCADTLETALEKVAQEDVDVVLLDLMLPDSRGLGTLASFRDAARRVPVIVLTGMSDASSGVKAVALGAQDYIGKDALEGKALRRAIEFAIERNRLVIEIEDVLRNAPEGMVIVDKAGVTRFVNTAAVRLLRAERGSLLGNPFPHPLPVAGRVATLHMAAWGEARFLEVKAASMEWHGGPATLLSLRDVSELKRLEGLRTAMAQQTRSHRNARH